MGEGGCWREGYGDSPDARASGGDGLRVLGFTGFLRRRVGRGGGGGRGEYQENVGQRVHEGYGDFLVDGEGRRKCEGVRS